MLLRSLLLLLAAAPLAAADTITVPSDFESIQQAVNAAKEGDTILVKPGVYAGTVTLFQKEGLVLRGKGKPVIDATGLGEGLFIDDCDDIEVSGFVVENASLLGIAVRESSDITVRKCTVREGCAAAGLQVDEGLRVLFEKNRIEQTEGTGIVVTSFGAIPTTDTQVLRNQIVSVAAIGIGLTGVDLLVERNVIDDCGAIGILMDTMSSGCTLSRNKVLNTSLGGIEVLSGDGVLIERNTIMDAGEIGLLLTSSADGAATLGNKIIRAGNNGFVINADGCELEGDRVLDANGIGLAIGGLGNQLLGVRSLRADLNGFTITAAGNELTSCSALKSDDDGFLVAIGGNTFTSCKAKGNGDLDLDDPNGAGMNTYVKCKFGTSNL